MNIYIASLYLKEGIKVRRQGWNQIKGWEQIKYLSLDNIQFIKLSLDDLIATDWELVTEDNHVV
jgi:hypothetical protein